MHRRIGIVVLAATVAGCSPATPTPSAAASPLALPSAGATSATPTSTVPSPTASATTAPPPTPTPSPLPQPSHDPAFDEPASADGWRLALPSGVLNRTQLEDVAWTGSRFVGVEALGGPAFVDSLDGIHWSVQHNDPSWHPSSIDVLDGNAYATGLIGDRPASWQSPDGASWTRVPTIPGNAVIAGDGRWVAVGETPTGPCASECFPDRGLAWTSSDGRTWKPAPRQASLEHAALEAIVPNGDGYLAAGEVDRHGALWSSPDGGTWTRLRGVSFGGQGEHSFLVGGLAWIGDTLVVAGSDNTQDSSRAIAYWADAGLSWQAAVVDGASESQIVGLTAAGRELLAYGPSGGCPGGIWSTTDGRRWGCVARGTPISTFAPSAAAASSDMEVVAGYTDSNDPGPNGFPGAIWWRPVPRP